MLRLRQVADVADDARLRVVLPAPVAFAVRGWNGAAERDLRRRIVLALFAEGTLSSGAAAAHLELSRRDRMDLPVRREMPWPITVADVPQDLARPGGQMGREGRTCALAAHPVGAGRPAPGVK